MPFPQTVFMSCPVWCNATSNSSAILVLLTTAVNAYFLDGSVDVTENSACWLAAYVLAPTAVAIINVPTPPTDRLLGKSPEWVNAYTKAYKNTMRLYRADSSIRGCILGGVVLLAMVYMFSQQRSGSLFD